MSNILNNYVKSYIEDFINNITSGVNKIYAFASNPIQSTNTSVSYSSDYNLTFIPAWQMLFGKLLANNNVSAMVVNTPWTANTIYTMYDNTSNTMYANSNYYVYAPPVIYGGNYNVYKCISNANGSPSLYQPSQVQQSTFTTADGYMWRYISTITNAIYNQFSASNYAPIYANSTIVSGAYNYSGIDVINVTNAGSYSCYNNGVVIEAVTNNIIQISSAASLYNDYYTGGGIYLYNNSASTAQLFQITKYTSNSYSGQAVNLVTINGFANTAEIINEQTNYLISPYVSIQSDAVSSPAAYTTINAVSNSISSIVVINPGYGISWANVSIVSNTINGFGGTAYAIVPPSGGHGSNPIGELNPVGIGINFQFANTESNTIPTGVSYNTIGLIKNPSALNANATQSNTLYSNTTFSQVLVANISGSGTFNAGDSVIGQTSNAYGIVAFANTTQLYITGDKTFITGESILDTNDNASSIITINTIGGIYPKNLEMLYVQNINNITHSNTLTEAYKLIIQV